MPRPLSDLVDMIEDLSSRARVQDRSRRAARQIGETMLQAMRKSAPVGEKWTDLPIPIYRGYGETRRLARTLNFGRPSLRQYGHTIETGWLEPEVEQIPGGSKVTVSNLAPQAGITASGSPKHPVPAAYITWQTWFRPGMDAPAFTIKTDHPGQRKNDYPDRAYQDSEQKIADIYEREMIEPLLEMFK